MSQANAFDELTVDHLYANVWTRSALSMRDRSLITVALLAALGRDAEFERHLQGALHQSITAEEIMELLIHVAHYAGWPAGRNAMRITKRRDLVDLNVRIDEGEKKCGASWRPSWSSAGPTLRTGATTSTARTANIRLFRRTPHGKPANAILVLGHQPLLGWLAHEMTGEKIPLAHSELACVAFDTQDSAPRYGTLRWVLSPSSTTVIEELKEKIRSKMEMAKLLSGFITAAVALMLGTMADKQRLEYLGAHRWALYAATVCFLGAVVLYLGTLYAFDRLLMPIRFWSDTAPAPSGQRPLWLVWRPPSSAAWVLYQNMMRIWRLLFTPATSAVLLGLFLAAFAVFKAPLSVLAVGPAALALFWLYYRWAGPRLGTQD